MELIEEKPIFLNIIPGWNMPIPEDFMFIINHNILVRDAHFLAFCCCFGNFSHVVTSCGDSYKLTNHKTCYKCDLAASFSM